MRLFNELKRRNVFKVGVAYVVLAWLLAQVADLMLENFGAPDWVIKTFLGFLIIGFPLAVFFAWAFELTPDGIKREKEVDRTQSITTQTGQKLNHLIIAILVIAVGWFAWDKFVSEPVPTGPAELVQSDSVEAPMLQASDNKSIAVLPFVAMSSGEDDEYFADGLTEEILNSLAQLPELLVTARTSAFHFKGKDIPVQEIAQTLGVQHIVEGSVRKSGQRLRVTAQLIRADDGFHLWSENYDSTSDDTISVQEDIAEKIAQAMDIVMDDEKRELMRKAGLRDVEAFIAYQKGMELFEKAHGDEDIISILRKANGYFEFVTDRVPGFASAYVEHSDVFVHILLHDTSGMPLPGVTEEDISSALDHAVSDYSAAVEHASSRSQRMASELDLAYITGNWRGISRKIENYITEPGCRNSNWVHTMAPAFGYASRYLAKAHEDRLCDPLSSQAWLTESRIALWSGDSARALEVARQGDQVAPSNWLNMALFRALLASGDFKQAEAAIDARFTTSNDALVSRVMLVAAQGDLESAQQFFTEYMKDPETSEFWTTILYAWMGDRENANLTAAKMDTHAYGPGSLVTIVYWCACGAPWDLDATPVFAQKLEEAGLSWPPVSPIEFPLKDW
jgi:TolB-like protein